MALINLAAYLNALHDYGQQIVHATVPSATVVAGRHYDLWVPHVPAGAAPTSPAVPTNDTIGALAQRDGTSIGIVGCQWSGMTTGTLLICDRLSHQGGLSGTVTGAQTTNLPTAALTRSTSGTGVMIGLTIYTAIGTTATTVTVTYTNDSGLSNRVSPTVAIGATGFNAAYRMIQIPLQAGDTGVQSVQSVTLAATTGTAGNFGVTLYRPIYAMALESAQGLEWSSFVTGGTHGGIPAIPAGACLFPIIISNGVNAQGNGTLKLAEI